MRKHELDKLLNEEWYIQGGNLTPIYLMEAWMSGFNMKDDLGAAYSAGIFTSKNETGELYYRVSDLERLYNFAFGQWQKDRGYFKKIRAQYVESQKPHTENLKEIDSLNLKELSLDAIYGYARKAIEAITASVGLGHIIEAISIPSDERLKKALEVFARDSKELNKAFIVLTVPETQSFAQTAEEELRVIANLPEPKQGQAIRDYIKRWGWMRNSYAGRKSMREDEIRDEVNAIARMKERAVSRAGGKEYWIRKLNIDDDLAERFKVLTFIADWQDERKKYILLAIDRLETLLEVLSERIGISANNLRYCLRTDINKDLPSKKEDLASRRAGVCVIVVPDETLVLTGKEYRSAISVLVKGHTHEGNKLRGMAASLGVVRGKVKICTTLESLNTVKKGDILVASMTRPEYLSAMKKAAAFVTDEGGITSHAAIVAREMRKPCIIGTKIATKVLKDGDLVEVDANKGVVYKLK